MRTLTKTANFPNAYKILNTHDVLVISVDTFIRINLLYYEKNRQLFRPFFPLQLDTISL